MMTAGDGRKVIDFIKVSKERAMATAISNPSLALPLPRGGVKGAPREFPIHPASGYTVPLHYWLVTLKWTGLLLLGGVVLFLIERFGFGLVHQKHVDDMRHSLAKDPARAVTMALGLAHYTIATYFLLTSKKIRSPRGLALLGLFTLIGVAICWLSYLAGGASNRLVVIAVLIFFLVHGLRDEVFFYRQRAGKALTDEEYPHVYRMLIWVQAASLFVVAAILYPIYIYGFLWVPGHPQVQAFVDGQLPASWPLELRMAATSLPFALLAAVTWWGIQRQHPGGAVALLRSHRPMATILGCYFVAAVSVAVVGLWIIHVAILLHFIGWYVFAAQEIDKTPRDVQGAITWRTPDQWFRRNLTGFHVFHGSLIALFFGLAAFHHWGMAEMPMTVAGYTLPNILWAVSAKNAFYYWTIMHITLAFMPKPAAKRR
jgi:hypothetical protein